MPTRELSRNVVVGKEECVERMSAQAELARVKGRLKAKE